MLKTRLKISLLLTSHCKCANLRASGLTPAHSTHNMKKTLITLAALAMASTAGAVTTYTDADFVASESSGVSTGVLTLDKALTFTQDWTLWVEVTVGTGTGNNWGTTIIAGGADPFNYASGDGNFTGSFQAWQNAANTETQYKLNTNSASVLSGDNAWNVGDTYTFTVYYLADTQTIGINGSGFDRTNTIADTTATISQLSTAAYGREGWGLTIKQWDTIPEPTTATLSLLALAGLAARRRRK